MSELKVGDKVRIDAARALLTYAQGYKDAYFSDPELDLEHIRKLMSFDGFEAEVVLDSRNSYPELKPLSERPDGHGMLAFGWPRQDLVKIED